MTPNQSTTADMAAHHARATVAFVARHRITGKLLHQSGLCMTDVPTWAWRGSKDQFRRLADRHGFEQASYQIEAADQ